MEEWGTLPTPEKPAGPGSRRAADVTNVAESVEGVLSAKWEGWKLSPPGDGWSRAVSLLAVAEQANTLDLKSLTYFPHEAEAELQELILSRPERAIQIMEWAFSRTDEWDMTPEEITEERRDQLRQNLKRLEACETQEEAAQCLLDVLMEAVNLAKDLPPLDRE